MSSAPPILDALERMVEHRLTRLLLAALVIVSLLPLTQDVETALRPVFLLLFGGELALRWSAWWRRDESLSLGRVLMGLIDMLALVSFLPLEQWLGAEQIQVLALLRLTRLSVLLRYAQALAIDVYTIMTRREQLQQFALVTGAVLFLSFVSAVILSQLAIPHDERPHASFLDRLWWSFRQMESADNLVPTLAANPVLIVLSLLLTVTGVFIISFIIGIGTTVVDHVVRAERRRPVTYEGHTLVTGPVHSSSVLMREFVRIYAKNRQIPSPERLLTWLRFSNPLRSTRGLPRVALLGREETPPAFLWEPLMRWVVYREGDAAEPTALDCVGAAQAKRAILLAREDLVHDADAVTVATLAAFRAQNPNAVAFVEVTDSASVPIVEQVGGPRTVALNMPQILGMFLCQHLMTPGVELLYRDLLTADGSELYTHIFVDEDERSALRARGDELLPFEAMARAAHTRHGVILLGVLLGPQEMTRGMHGLVTSHGLVPWMNPTVLPVDDERPVELGARAGLIPARALRGLVAVAESYLPLAAAARELALEARPSSGGLPSSAAGDSHRTMDLVGALTDAVGLPSPGPRRVALIGASDALPALLRELSLYVPGIEVTLFVSQRGGERVPMARRLEELHVGFSANEPLPGRAGRAFGLSRGGTLTIFTHDGPDLVGFVARTLGHAAPVEAAVFLSEPEGEERDARTSLRILRFARALTEGLLQRGRTLHILAEFISVEKGAHIQELVHGRACGFGDESDVRLTLVSTDTVKNYFLVHSAFVPAVTSVYEELLAEKGQEIVRLPFQAPAGWTTLTLEQAWEALMPLGALPFAFELEHRDLVLGPAATRQVAAAQVTGIYVVTDIPLFTRAAQTRATQTRAAAAVQRARVEDQAASSRPDA